jgi:hypothetical protein
MQELAGSAHNGGPAQDGLEHAKACWQAQQQRVCLEDDKNECAALAHTWMGALYACAASTRLMIFASTVCPPTQVTRTYSSPEPLTVPPITPSPGCFVTCVEAQASTTLSKQAGAL